MSKWKKGLLGLAAVGGAVAGIAYYLKKSDSRSEESTDTPENGDDFDLDDDLKPVNDREYVPLNVAPQEETDAAAEEKEAEDSADKSDENAEASEKDDSAEEKDPSEE